VGEGLASVEAFELVDEPWESLAAEARRLRELGHGRLVTYSPKVFIPLTKLCRDVCGYCTFAQPPRRGERAYMSEAEVLEVARAGAAAGCREALFTLGDKPELRYRVARDELAALGCSTTLEYLAHSARLVLEETGLLPHVNPGVLSLDDTLALREVSDVLKWKTSSIHTPHTMDELVANRFDLRGNRRLRAIIDLRKILSRTQSAFKNPGNGYGASYRKSDCRSPWRYGQYNQSTGQWIGVSFLIADCLVSASSAGSRSFSSQITN